MVVNNRYKLYRDIYSKVLNNNISLAFDLINSWSNELDIWWINERYEELFSIYMQMLKFSLSQVEDPNRTAVIRKLKYDMLSMVDDIYSCELSSNSDLKSHLDTRFQNQIFTDETESTIIKLIDDGGNQYSDEAIIALKSFWEKIYLSNRLSSGDESFLNNVLLNDKLIRLTSPMVLSALLLRVLKRYDVAILRIALSFSASEDDEIRVRAQFLFITILSKYSEYLFLESDEIQALVKRPLKVILGNGELLNLSQSILETLETAKITNKIESEIYSEMLKSSKDFKLMMLDKDDSDNEANPKWSDAIENGPFAAKLREFSELQAKGADIFMSTFSKMKSYPFFTPEANWFMPFDEKNGIVKKVLDEAPDVMRIFAKSPQMCSSDKYSFFLSVSNMPSEYYNMMGNMDNEMLQQFKDDTLIEKWKKGNESYQFVVRSYIQDVYRFFNLKQNTKKIDNPLDVFVGFISSNTCFNFFDDNSYLRAVVGFLVEKESWQEALKIFNYLDNSTTCDAYFYQQMGWVYQQIDKYKNAIDCYVKSELYGEVDGWLLKRKAYCYKKIDDIDEAIKCYESLITNNSEDYISILAVANLYLQKDDLEKAHNYLFRADFLRPMQSRVLRPLAWCLFLEKKYEDSLVYYTKLVSNADVKFVDFLNLGHVYWAIGSISLARQQYTKALTLCGNKQTFVSLLRGDIEYLGMLGISDEDVFIMIDQVLLDIK